MPTSEVSPVFSALTHANGNRRTCVPELRIGRTGTTNNGPLLVSTKQLSKMWDMPESTLRYWRCAGIGPAYVKLGGRINYDLADVEAYVRANKQKPSVRAHGWVSDGSLQRGRVCPYRMLSGIHEENHTHGRSKNRGTRNDPI
jgi:Helix-turn-helix domain